MYADPRRLGGWSVLKVALFLSRRFSYTSFHFCAGVIWLFCLPRIVNVVGACGGSNSDSCHLLTLDGDNR